MNPLLGCLAAAVALFLPLPAVAGLSEAPDALVRQAAGGSPEAADRLRDLGPAGLDALLAAAQADPALAASATWPAALDRVCAQYDCAASHLYWYTDLARARAAALGSGRPILSLRLLGRLDEELSCANSRLFRSVLYADPAVSRFLTERFVLYWSSERPVPKVTVDFGDGRRLVGTVTGNSIHYVLDARGRLVDALPGLYGPRTFLDVLGRAEAEAREVASLPDAEVPRALAAFHRSELEAQNRLFAAAGDPRPAGIGAPLRAADAGAPRAREASALTVSKRIAQAPFLRRTTLVEPAYDLVLDAPVWERLRPRYVAEAHLDAASRRLLLAKGGAYVGEDKDAALARFEGSIADDTERNELVLHRRLHAWLAGEPGLPDPAAFNERVYRELFLTPRSDPWLGLGPTEVFSVITPAPS